VQIAKALIKKNIQQDSQLERIAKQLNISSSRLRHLFTYEMGISPAQYQKALRLQKAKHLLETTFLNVKEIMLQVGIKDESNFVRDFKRYYGVSPTMYRKQLSEEMRQGRVAIFTNE
jgi:AraC-like DNA-binding protein